GARRWGWGSAGRWTSASTRRPSPTGSATPPAAPGGGSAGTESLYVPASPWAPAMSGTAQGRSGQLGAAPGAPDRRGYLSQAAPVSPARRQRRLALQRDAPGSLRTKLGGKSRGQPAARRRVRYPPSSLMGKLGVGGRLSTLAGNSSHSHATMSRTAMTPTGRRLASTSGMLR